MPTHNRPLILLLAVFAALVINVIGLIVLDHLLRHPPARCSIAPSSPPDKADDEDAAEEEALEEPPFQPGIENSIPATVTWIGYNEYQEHLAELAEVEQALFTMADGGVVGPQVPAQPLVEPIPAEELVEVAAETPTILTPPELPNVENKNAAAEPADEETTVVDSELSTPIEMAERTAPADETTATVIAPENSESLALPSADVEPEPEMKVETSSAVTEAVEEKVAEDVAAGVVEATAPIPEVNVKQEEEVPVRVPLVSGTTGNPSPDPRDSDAVPTDKETQATSRKPVPEIAWNAGKPLAVEGMEIKPYSLTRHIIIDAKDRLFRLRGWAGKVKRNPLVSLQFDRFGNLARLRIVRDTGYTDFDQRYLKSWLARWTAQDKRLAELAENEMTNPIVIKLKFIDEPAQERKNGKIPGNSAKKADH